MAIVFLTLGVVVVFVLAFLIDISINLRRVDGNLKKMINNYDKAHGSTKA